MTAQLGLVVQSYYPSTEGGKAGGLLKVYVQLGLHYETLRKSTLQEYMSLELFQASGPRKQADIVSDSMYFKPKLMKTDEDGHFILIKEQSSREC